MASELPGLDVLRERPVITPTSWGDVALFTADERDALVAAAEALATIEADARDIVGLHLGAGWFVATEDMAAARAALAPFRTVTAAEVPQALIDDVTGGA